MSHLVHTAKRFFPNDTLTQIRQTYMDTRHKLSHTK